MTQEQIKTLINAMRSGADTKISGDELEDILKDLADAITSTQTLTDGPVITFDYALGEIGTVTLGGNRAVSFTNLSSGATGLMIVKQDATGGRTLTFPVSAKLPVSGLALSSGANAATVIGFLYDGTNIYLTKENYS